jgi:hypothetical protein
MFNLLRHEVDDRFRSLKSFFGATRHFKGELGATAKGLAFVHLYAAYEYTVRSVVQVSIASINAHGHKMKDLTPSLLTLYLDPELTALRDAGRANIWNARLKVVERAFSDDALDLSTNTRPPSDGSHYRHTHLVAILNVFGISRSPARRRRHLYRIDEVVQNRNKVAHGEESPSNIGRRYSRSEILHAIGQINSVCSLLIAIFEGFCSEPSRHRRY